jgi:hypothetical protein
MKGRGLDASNGASQENNESYDDGWSLPQADHSWGPEDVPHAQSQDGIGDGVHQLSVADMEFHG